MIYLACKITETSRQIKSIEQKNKQINERTIDSFVYVHVINLFMYMCINSLHFLIFICEMDV